MEESELGSQAEAASEDMHAVDARRAGCSGSPRGAKASALLTRINIKCRSSKWRNDF